MGERMVPASARLTVLVTGASGLLGRAVRKEFERRRHNVVGVALSRATMPLLQLNLVDFEATKTLVNSISPDVLVHCAAERRPDICEDHVDEVLKLNVGVSQNLAELCAASPKLPFLIYISTDYVFDGKNAPYDVDAKPSPLNFYGLSKLRGEGAVMDAHANVAVLRVPVLYGEAEREEESAVNILIKAVKDEKPIKMDDHAIRYPTNVSDVARIIADLSEKRCIDSVEVTGVFHFSGKEKMTKYDICKIFAKLLGKSLDHMILESGAPPLSTAIRPYDCHLSNRRLESVAISCASAGFADWWSSRLS